LTLEYITVSVLGQVTDVIKQERPDYILVQGDTTTAMAASLAAFGGLSHISFSVEDNKNTNHRGK